MLLLWGGFDRQLAETRLVGVEPCDMHDRILPGPGDSVCGRAARRQHSLRSVMPRLERYARGAQDLLYSAGRLHPKLTVQE